MSIAVLVPSRGRPARAAEMVASVIATARSAVSVFLIVDRDDPELDVYEGLQLLPNTSLRILGDRLGYTGSLNLVAREIWDDFDILGAFGDDVRFRTHGWDRRVRQSLRTPGIAYGNDLVHAAGHPTAIFMSSSIAKALGWLALPASWHLWVDDAWKRLGQETDTLRYLPHVIFEHLHPAVGKADMDQTYREVYDADRGHQDHLGFLAWERDGLSVDVAKVRAVL